MRTIVAGGSGNWPFTLLASPSFYRGHGLQGLDIHSFMGCTKLRELVINGCGWACITLDALSQGPKLFGEVPCEAPCRFPCLECLSMSIYVVCMYACMHALHDCMSACKYE